MLYAFTMDKFLRESTSMKLSPLKSKKSQVVLSKKQAKNIRGYCKYKA
jgi:hypothetical protein